MSSTFRGADLVARVLARAGVADIYTLSGNHIMPLFDAMLDTGARLVHTRHEAAAVHMADAHGRLTGAPGIALVTGGQGHTNAVAALTTAQCAEAPLVLVSGHAPVRELGRGAFQELAQVALAAPVTKAAWMVERADRLGHDLAKALRVAASGRPGPVHVSLPSDLLEETLDDDARLMPGLEDFAPIVTTPSDGDAGRLWSIIRAARRPLVIAGPSMCTASGQRAAHAAERGLGVPVVGMESPRGINDPCLGAFAEVLKEADFIVLLGKPHDFTLRFCEPPVVHGAARFAVVDPETAHIARAEKEKPGRIDMTIQADAAATLAALCDAADPAHPSTGWLNAVRAARAYRPAAWAEVAGPSAKIHPMALMRDVAAFVRQSPDAVFISDGGEIGQWAQAGISAPRRIINGVAGSIGAALPFALAARVVERNAPVVTVMGDGTFGFHMAEVETAVRHGLPFVCVVGNDARWNAEHQIQLRDYGPARTHACSLAPTRYDEVAVALGGHGELVTEHAGVAPALARAAASGKPAVVNVMIDGLPAPVIRRS